MTVRYPAPLRPGDAIGVTAPSAGVPDRLGARLDVALQWLRDRGFRVEVGDCLRGGGVVSAPREQRAAELNRMLLDPRVRAVVPPWGGETGIDLLELIAWEAVAAAEPTWCVGFSDTSTWLTPLTLLTGVATLHGQNLMDTPYATPDGIRHWVDVASAPRGSEVEQRSPGRFRAEGWDDYERDPAVSTFTLDAPGTWTRLDPGHEGEPARLTGRLLPGCVETMVAVAGTRFGDVPAFAREHAPDGLLHALDVCEWPAPDIGRALHGMRLAGWFDGSRGVLVSRTRAPGTDTMTQHEAVVDALGGLGVPILADVECGHVPPYLALVAAARTEVVHAPDDGGGHRVTQWLD
ncbi:muramoyltetrapeptide carboxypeptidase LdcA involved in peptidoglycan recycling [Terracoccus luteus]|uniref:Muramoyltetrapeptide carboxypeptidase LdcA involved in peptidoglycan recycling n=1 Tax=Terracoccus luteus TaxID=53356 RepID=A0A495XUR9_9MICO|nr:LD-carboxypeptidase [Terracoccus luteus]RKT77269.1 muramoyltetrapeptide carboxypeptidase LdcA involved in peptidoglycan recycling [Terracoccus luteus]